jgi:hypothetical protein
MGGILRKMKLRALDALTSIVSFLETDSSGQLSLFSGSSVANNHLPSNIVFSFPMQCSQSMWRIINNVLHLFFRLPLCHCCNELNPSFSRPLNKDSTVYMGFSSDCATGQQLVT